MKIFQLTKKTRFVIAYPVIVLAFIFAHTTEKALFWGVLLALTGEGIRFWANGYIGHNKVNRTRKSQGETPMGHLITSGPYRFVRHPLYLGTFLITAGLCSAVGQWLFAAPVLMAFILVYRKKMGQEDALLLDEIGPEYIKYQSQTPGFLPRLKPVVPPNGLWSWQGIRASKEWKTLLWICVLFIVFYLREEFYQEGEFFTEADEIPKHLFFMAAAALFIAGDLVINRKSNKYPTFPKPIIP